MITSFKTNKAINNLHSCFLLVLSGIVLGWLLCPVEAISLNSVSFILNDLRVVHRPLKRLRKDNRGYQANLFYLVAEVKSMEFEYTQMRGDQRSMLIIDR